MLRRRLTLLLPVLLAVMAAFLTGGCRSNEYFQARAAEAARKYLLAHAPELTPEQIYFVKYNDPVLLTAQVLGRAGQKGEEEHTSSSLHQFCVTWNIPGASNLYMVFGVSDIRMVSWSPIRLIRKDFSQKVMPEDAAVALCRRFAVDSLYHSLTPEQLNDIRFEFPVIAWTDFALNFNTTGRKTADEIKAAQLAAEKLCQYSLIWKNKDGSATVFCGLSQPDLKGWQLNFAGHVTREDLNKHTRQVVRTPEEPDDNIRIPAKFGKGK